MSNEVTTFITEGGGGWGMRNVLVSLLFTSLLVLLHGSLYEGQHATELNNVKVLFSDDDNDGFDGDDDCPSDAGNSSRDRNGCLDSDGDGYSDSSSDWNVSHGADAFPLRSDAWSDQDGDGYTDQPNLNITDDCPLRYGKSRLILWGCSDMDLDWIPDVLDDDIDGDGISNEMERAASLILTYYDPMDANSVPADSDFDTLPDAIDDDDDNDGWPDIIEQDRGSNPKDYDDTPFTQYFGVNSGFFYLGGIQSSSEYDAEAFEISLSGIVEIVTEELVIPLLLIPIYLYFFVSRRKRFEELRLEIKNTESKPELLVLEKKVNLLIENRKIKTLHGLILRNTIEERENGIPKVPSSHKGFNTEEE
tara:strand:- start:643 stop:1731 length:1089 start_codon:yes stop_codon:yes gene_type:complete